MKFISYCFYVNTTYVFPCILLIIKYARPIRLMGALTQHGRCNITAFKSSRLYCTLNLTLMFHLKKYGSCSLFSYRKTPVALSQCSSETSNGETSVAS
jgi:hypothetical protein